MNGFKTFDGRVSKAIPMPAMRCDHTGFVCLAEVKRAPVVVIPGLTPFEEGHKPIRFYTPLHYCEFHRGDFDVQSYLSDAQKRRIEVDVRAIRPSGFRPDFDAAFADLVLVTTPEYRRFMVHIGVVQRAVA